MLEIQGHHQQKELLRSLRTHTLLFSGQESIGKRQVARWYAALLNCQNRKDEPCGNCTSCRAFSNNSTGDYREFSPETNTKSGKKSRKVQFRIDSLVQRDGGDPNPLAHWLEQRPQFRRRVAIIDGAEYLNEAAANALLKTLEEPPSFSVIILLSSQLEAVLPTIVSRAVPIRFGTVPINDADPQARLGQVGIMQRIQENSEEYEQLTQLIDNYITSLTSTLYAAFEAADALEKAWLNDHSFDIEMLLRTRLSAAMPSTSIHVAFQQIEACSQAIEAYVASGLAVQVMTLKLRQLLN